MASPAGVGSPTITSPAKSKSNYKLKLTGAPSPATRAISKPVAPVQDVAEQLNEETRKKYEKGKKLGEGTYAIVYLAHLAKDPTRLFAIKKIKINTEFKDGLAMDAIREIKFLQELKHPNIIRLHDVFDTKSQNLNLVLEYVPLGDLEMLIRDTDNVNYGVADMKSWMVMLSRAVWFCHENFVLHRDIKPNNVFIAGDGAIKLADFGLARNFADPGQPMTHQMITRWYRPLELFYKARHYSGAVDVWSVGMVFAELILRRPYLPGATDLNQVELICQNLGTPTNKNWDGVEQLDAYTTPSENKIPERDRTYFRSVFGAVGDDGVDLLQNMLKLDPRKRLTARHILEHKWWTVMPRPTKKEDLPKKGGGLKKMGEDLKRRGGELDRRGDKVARKLDFASASK